MTNTSKNAVINGLVGSTVSIGYGAMPPAPSPLTIGKAYTTNTIAGQFLTSGSNGTAWSTSNDTVLKVNQSPASLEVKGRLVINGVDLEERLNTIEKVLSIPERDVRIEEKHPKLKKLYEEYIAALGKYRTWEAIKGEE
jgi:hypothetical protein